MRHIKIKINKLEFTEETILKNIDFVVNENDRICIVGNNGAGKTTLMKTIIGEEEENNNSVAVRNYKTKEQSVEKLEDFKNRIVKEIEEKSL
ncbi:MAG: ATP-binding cassette domain-containing protein [Candidatus Gracilibacteria bacterium]|nr:ATP-binding cassette domain-containing protein [Candidatus Gracilibacteria bacterium]